MSPVYLDERDWSEIYYALDSKQQEVSDDHEWVGHLENIKEKIGPDGIDAVAQGVPPLSK
jgi:hypothetical protein